MNIYVSNLSFQTNEEDLKDLFSKYGNVSSARVIMDKMTNRSRGFAFIEMPSEEEGNAALKGLNGKDVEGRTLSASVAREKEDRGGSGRNSFSRSGNKRFF